jgi:endoglucanase
MIFRTMALLLAGAVGVASALTPVETHGKLKVDGTGQLMDQNGKAVVLRGMSFYWSSELTDGGRYYTKGATRWLAEDWKVSVVRAAIGVESISTSSMNYLKSSAAATTMDGYLDNVVQGAISAGIYIIIDWHAHQLHASEANAFFEKAAKAYGSYPNVLFETFNEPNGPGWGELVSYHNSLITTIRKYSDNVIIVGNPGYSSEPAMDPGVTDSKNNVCYTLHAYTSSHSYLPRADAAIAKKRCVFVTEWGSTTSDGASSYNWSTAQGWLSGLETRKISHVNWDVGSQQLNPANSTDNTVQASAALIRYVNANGGWDPATDLTQGGKDMRSWLRDKNSGYTPPPREPPVFSLVTDTIKPSGWVTTSNVDSVASGDGMKFQMANAKAGGSVTYSIKPNNTGYFQFNIRVKSASAGTIKITANGTTKATVNVPAGASFTTILDTLEFDAYGKELPLKLEFDAAMSLSFIKFVKKVTIAGVATRPVKLDGVVRFASKGASYEALLGDGHAWTRASAMNGSGRIVWAKNIGPSVSTLAIPSGTGISWLVLSSETGNGIVAMPPVR